MTRPPALTVLVLCNLRAGPLDPFFRDVVEALRPIGELEFVFALEPWFREDAEAVALVEGGDAPIRVLVASHAMGETGLVRMALPECRAPRLLILTANPRVESAALPGVVHALEDADLVIGRRWPRRDRWLNRVQGRLFHRVVGRLLGHSFQDLASGVRAVRRDVMEELPLYGDLYRFLPVLAARDGFRVVEVDCPQHPEDRPPRMYQPGVYLRRALDLFGLYFLVRFTEKPLRFFGLIGGLVSLAGAVMLVILVAQRVGGEPMADRPMLLLGVLLLVLGTQAVALGLVGEIIVHINAAQHRRYRLARQGSPPANGTT